MSFLNSFSEASMKLIQAEHPYISSIYIDLEFLQDLRFGALLMLLTSPTEFESVYKYLDKYNDRFNEKTCTYFPEITIKDTDIDTLLSDSIKLAQVACMAPMTSMYYNLISIIAITLRTNQYSESTTDKILQLYISTDYLNYPDPLLEKLKTDQEKFFNQKIVVNTEKTQRYTQSLNYFQDKQYLFLYDFESFVNKPQIAMSFASDGKFSDTKIYAKPQVKDSFLHLKRKEILNGIDKMRDQLNIYCDFEYCLSQIVIKKGGN